MRLAREGYGVIYEPRSTVTHVRYGSGSPEHAIALSERNRQLFAERWHHRLIGRPSTFSSPNGPAVIAARDALANPRLLICAERNDPDALALALFVQGQWRRARVTWAAGAPPAGGPPIEPSLASEVEVVERDDPSWLGERLFHYDVLAIRANVPERTRERAASTQPQAVRIMLDELAGRNVAIPSRVLEAMSAAGVAPPSSLLGGHVGDLASSPRPRCG